LDELDERAAAQYRPREATDLWTVFTVIRLALGRNLLRGGQPFRLAWFGRDWRPPDA
jgi:hypothetical protein